MKLKSITENPAEKLDKIFIKYLMLITPLLTLFCIIGAILKFFNWHTKTSESFVDTPTIYLLLAVVCSMLYKIPSLIDRVTSLKVGNNEIQLQNELHIIKDVIKSSGLVGGKDIDESFDSLSKEYVIAELKPNETSSKGTEIQHNIVQDKSFDSDDPQKGRWGGKSADNDRLLDATVKSVPGDRDWFNVELSVRSTNQEKPMTGKVVFYLHDSFSPSVINVKVRDGVAKLQRYAWGAFTVGVEVIENDGTRTKLELDLASMPNAPKIFRVR